MTEQANAVRDREERIQKVLERIEWEMFFDELIAMIDRVREQCKPKERFDA